MKISNSPYVDIDIPCEKVFTIKLLSCDDFLVQIAQAAKEAVHRAIDLVAPYGGEEFVVILANTDQQGAIAIAEGSQKAIRTLAIAH